MSTLAKAISANPVRQGIVTTGTQKTTGNSSKITSGDGVETLNLATEAYDDKFQEYEKVVWPADISPDELTGDVNNYSPDGLGMAAVLRLSSDNTRTITGLDDGEDGRVIILQNIGSNEIILADESSSSDASNRFTIGGDADLTLSSEHCAILQYDNTSARWRLIGSSAGGSGGSGSGAPTSAQYVTLAANSQLTAERILTGVSGIRLTDEGAGSNLLITMNPTGVGVLGSMNFTGRGLTLSGRISPGQITSNQNNYAPTGSVTSAVFRLNSDAERTITGLAGGSAADHQLNRGPNSRIRPTRTD